MIDYKLAVVRYLRSFLVCVGLGLVSVEGAAQYRFSRGDIPVIQDGSELSMPWAGGLNSIQYNSLDLNGDQVDDLVLFDRSANKISTYLYLEGAFQYAPAYENTFPDNLVSWVMLRDYDCDGLNDLFTDSQLGMRVFRNSGSSPPSWELAVDPVKTLGTQVINLFFNASDIASIEDLDGDGDLDVLAYNFATGETIDFHQNMSVENSGSCGLDFERVTRNYGNFAECNCGIFTFNEPCPVNGRILHSGGKSLLSIDLDNDGDLELITGEETCNELSVLINQGDAKNALFTGVTDLFTVLTGDSRLHFPAAYHVDLDMDGINDLAISSNLRENEEDPVDFTQSSFFLRNTGSSQSPDYSLTSTRFLQDQMIDVGERSYPAVVDYDRDGDQDLFIGSRGTPANNGISATIWFYENSGSANDPAFTLITDDYLNLSSLDLLDIKPQFVDLNSDALTDLVITTTSADGQSLLSYIPNNSVAGAPFELANLETLIDSQIFSENTFLTDINNDGVYDLLVGRTIGTLEYYENAGTNLVPNYQAVDAIFTDIERSIERINLVPYVYDLARDGNLDLVTSDASGEISIYQDFQTGGVAPVRTLLTSPLTAEVQETRFGRITWPVVTDLYNSGKIDLLVGTVGGGLHLLEDTSDLTPTPAEDPRLEVFPNPSDSNPVVIRSNVNGNFDLHSITGQVILTDQSLLANQPFILNSTLYQSGVYLVRFISDTGKSSTSRIIIN